MRNYLYWTSTDQYRPGRQKKGKRKEQEKQKTPKANRAFEMLEER